MSIKPPIKESGISRRDYLKLSGLTLGGLALGAASDASAGKRDSDVGDCYPTEFSKTQRYSYYNSLRHIKPGTPLGENEMRITFMGSAIPPVRRAQQMMSIFVEVGWDGEKALDQFVFDCGAGVCANYGAMNIGFGRMDKVFLCHLHGDHMSDLTHIYCFGPSADRKSPLYVWGPGPSGVVYTDPNGTTWGPYDDGTRTYCEMLRAANRWHSESFSFQSTSYTEYPSPQNIQEDWGLPVLREPVKDPRAAYDERYRKSDYIDSNKDAFALIPIELSWRNNGRDEQGNRVENNVAYHNKATGVKITHFPVIHCRQGSIGYKLEWKNPKDPNAPTLSMIYTSDTRPETNCLDQAINQDEAGKVHPVDVFIHEMIVPAEVWAMKTLRLPKPLPAGKLAWWDAVVDDLERVQASSHTPQGAFGYILSQLDAAKARPRLTVATHFPVADDTVQCALASVRAHCPWAKLGRDLIWSFDLMVLRVTPDDLKPYRALVSDFGWSPVPQIAGTLETAKYYTLEDGVPVNDARAQLDTSTEIPPGENTYRQDGY